MNHFKVSSSILSPEAIAGFVQNTYGLGTGTVCKLLKAGINHTYRIDSGKEQFIFRIYSYNWRTKEEITEELNLLLLLQKNGISISYPLVDVTGNYIHEIKAPEGLRYAVLFSYAPGHKVETISKEAHYEIGRLMARIHAVTNGMQQKRITYTPEVLLHKPLTYIKDFLPAETHEMQFMINTLPVLEQKLHNADQQLLRKGIVHLDIWFDNLNVSDDNKITLFDFDFCGNGWLCMDVAYYVLQLHQVEKNAEERAIKLKAFYEGYESIQKISDEERELIPALGVCLYYFYLGVQCQRFNNWSNTFLNEVYLKKFITILVKGYYDSTVIGKINT